MLVDIYLPARTVATASSRRADLVVSLLTNDSEPDLEALTTAENSELTLDLLAHIYKQVRQYLSRLCATLIKFLHHLALLVSMFLLIDLFNEVKTDKTNRSSVPNC